MYIINIHLYFIIEMYRKLARLIH